LRSRPADGETAGFVEIAIWLMFDGDRALKSCLEIVSDEKLSEGSSTFL
jgi:hypothetical protein